MEKMNATQVRNHELPNEVIIVIPLVVTAEEVTERMAEIMEDEEVEITRNDLNKLLLERIPNELNDLYIDDAYHRISNQVDNLIYEALGVQL